MSDIEDLFDYDDGLDDVLKNLPSAQNKETSQAETNDNDADATKVLGLDADIKPTKQRAPIAKLDEARLLSQKGVPKLRKDVRTKLKFKGKGHEFSDLGRLLNFYQLWLDDLYPRAKFADGLAMIEKLGHTKRVQIMRREWINEEKPDYRRRDSNHDDNNRDDNNDSTTERNATSADATTTNNNIPTINNAPVDDLLDDLFAEIPRRSSAPKQNTSDRPNDDAPPDDDLDMLLAEAEKVNSPPKESASNGYSTEDAPPDDDLDMLLAEAENANSASKQTSSDERTANPSVTDTHSDNDAPPDDDLDMLLAEAENIAQAGNGSRKSIFNS